MWCFCFLQRYWYADKGRLELLGRAPWSKLLERILNRIQRKEKVLEKDDEESTTPGGSFGVESADATGVIDCRHRPLFPQTSPKNDTFHQKKHQYRHIHKAGYQSTSRSTHKVIRKPRRMDMINLRNRWRRQRHSHQASPGLGKLCLAQSLCTINRYQY